MPGLLNTKKEADRPPVDSSGDLPTIANDNFETARYITIAADKTLQHFEENGP